ncbi:hypothetical protein PproGo58_22630 [Pseudomonas protegens]|nr:hypothetical protein PproGo58_22630 [Pseudomonas protegens]
MLPLKLTLPLPWPAAMANTEVPLSITAATAAAILLNFILESLQVNILYVGTMHHMDKPQDKIHDMPLANQITAN